MNSSREMLVLSGNAHPALAEAIAAELGTELASAHIGEFPDGETRVQILSDVRDRDVFLVQPTGPPSNHNVMESAITIDALRRASAGRVTAVTPYFGYARQDRKSRSREPITAKLVVDILETAGADRLLSVDLHAHQIQGFTTLPFDHLYAGRTIATALKGEIEEPVVVAPDVGAVKMVTGYAERMGDAPWAVVNKERVDGRKTKALSIVGENVDGRNALIIDDMTSTAGSLLEAARILKGHGAQRIIAAVTHGVLCGDAIDRLEQSDDLELLYATDSLPTQHRQTEKVRRITIAPLLASAIQSIHRGESVSSLF